MTLERQEQLYQILKMASIPTLLTNSDKVGIMILLAGPGSGKTQMIDSISRAGEIGVFERQHEILKEKRRMIEEDKEMNLNDKDEELRTIVAEEFELETTEEFCKNQLFFTPVTFNGNFQLFSEEALLSVSSLLAYRMLFFHFSCNISISDFLFKIRHIVEHLDPQKALHVMRYDLTSEGQPLPRFLVALDEIAKILTVKDPKDPIIDPSVRQRIHDNVYSTLRNGIFTCKFQTNKQRKKER